MLGLIVLFQHMLEKLVNDLVDTHRVVLPSEARYNELSRSVMFQHMWEKLVKI